MDKIDLGSQVKDLITGTTGVVINWYQWITGCDRAEVRYEVDKSTLIDETTLELLNNDVANKLADKINSKDDLEDAKFAFGDKVKDTITEYVGRICARHIGISGDITYGVSPRYDSKAKSNDASWYDEGRLILVEPFEKPEPEEIKTPSKRTGGPVPNIITR